MKVEEKSVWVEQIEVPYTHIQNESQKVCFMLSGASYTYDKPLFYYSTMVALENRFDVVHIHYSYCQEELHQDFEELAQKLVHDVKPIVSKVLTKQTYKKTAFLGKSLGTIPIIYEFMNNKTYSQSNVVLLTPLLQKDLLIDSLSRSNNQILLTIGTSDPHYIPEKVESLRNLRNIEIYEFADANHSLDIEGFDTRGSLSCLRMIMDRINNFLKE